MRIELKNEEVCITLNPKPRDFKAVAYQRSRPQTGHRGIEPHDTCAIVHTPYKGL